MNDRSSERAAALASLRSQLRGSASTTGAPDAAAPDEPADRSTADAASRMVTKAALNVADMIMGFAGNDSESVPVAAPRRAGIVLVVGDRTLPVRAQVVLGRENAAMPLDGRISRRHAVVMESRDGAVVVDAGSTNGTFIRRGDDLITVDDEPRDVRPGDRIVTVDDVLLALIDVEPTT